MTLRIHILQHVPFEGPAAIADWATLHGHTMTSSHLFASTCAFPDHNAYDVLVVMGGPMGVHDTAEFSWLQTEMDFVRASLDAGKKVLGICLGAQIIAHVLGGVVSRNPVREIGWFPISRTEGLLPPWVGVIPAKSMAFHWHGETFSLPHDAIPLASSQACQNQGFLWKNRALALQFHLETTEASAESLITFASQDLVGGGEWVQSAEILRSGAKEHSPALNRLLFQILDTWLA